MSRRAYVVPCAWCGLYSESRIGLLCCRFCETKLPAPAITAAQFVNALRDALDLEPLYHDAKVRRSRNP